MDLILKRTRWREDGVFGELLNDKGEPICVTAEHAYFDENFNYSPKVPEGSYKCVRGKHRLENAAEDIETFEITNVPGHTEILLHVGNFPQVDSSGCVILGTNVNKSDSGWSIESSRIAFDKFMKIQSGVNEFTLIVS